MRTVLPFWDGSGVLSRLCNTSKTGLRAGFHPLAVVLEPQEASDVVKAYPAINWSVAGLPALRTALVGCVIVTAVGGILSNPLFTWASQAVTGTPMLVQAIG